MLLFIWIRNNFSISYIPLIYSLLQKTTKKRKPIFYPEWEKDPTDTNDDVYYGLRYKPEAKKRYGLRGCNLNLKATVLPLHKRI